MTAPYVNPLLRLPPGMTLEEYQRQLMHPAPNPDPRDPGQYQLAGGQAPADVQQGPGSRGGLLRFPSDLLRGAARGLLGVDPSVQDPTFDPLAEQRNALLTAGLTAATVGGPQSDFRTLPLSPVQAILAGITAGRASYQHAQGQARDNQQTRQRYEGLLANVSPREGLLRVYQRAIEANDPDVARTAATQLAAMGAPEVAQGTAHPPRQVRLGNEVLLIDDAGNIINRWAVGATPRILGGVGGGRRGATTAGGPPSGAGLVGGQARAAAGTMTDANRELNALENADLAHSAAIFPSAAAAAEGVGNAPVVGRIFSGLTGPLAQSQLTDAQKAYRGAVDRWTHSYVANLPKSRVSPQLIEQLRQAFFPRAGQTDPRVIESFQRARNEATNRIDRALAGQPVDLSGLPGYEQGASPAAPGPTAAPTSAADWIERLRRHP